MGYTLTRSEFDQVLEGLSEKYRLYAPVLKKGQGRFTDTDVVIYDFVYSSSEIEFEKNEYSGTRDTSVRAFGNQHSGK